ncbi:MAG: histidine ammonia-lyase [Defluviitaleaceae bacterium]|nr:histidine ammonia-lyase [Defluviitaleaceae bacterium]
MKKVLINGNNLTLEDVVNVARWGQAVEIDPAAIPKINASRAYVESIVAQGRTVYGINTGFGEFSKVTIPAADVAQLQHNLIVSHACGIGSWLSPEIVRAMMLLRVNSLAAGFSGVRLELLQTFVDMLNAGVIPCVPEKGSLGASGDLAPLSHIALTLIGLGDAFYDGKLMTGAEAMEAAGIKPITLAAKEGLALINGTQAMTAIGALTLYDAKNLAVTADIAGALTMEALQGITCAFHPTLHAVRPQKGQIATAAHILQLVKGSDRVTKQGQVRVQDAYSIRCIPQIHGASKDALAYVEEKLLIEINAVTDNPIIAHEEDIAISGGNFHGQPIALPMDFLAIAIAELCNVSERRIERLVNPALSGLPGFLTEKGGINSGFMIAQYAAAALVSENKVLCHPASVDSIPSSANQEDHVSMGTIAARKASEVLFNLKKTLAIELLCAAQGVDLSGNAKLGAGTAIAYDLVRGVAPKLEEDREMYVDFERVSALIDANLIVQQTKSS